MEGALRKADSFETADIGATKEPSCSVIVRVCHCSACITPERIMPVPLDLVKKYSPVFRFHEDESCFPCSIDHLLHGSALYYRNFAWGTPITGQSSSSTPTLASFQGWLYLVYQSSNNFQMYLSRSNDGNTWQNTQAIPGVEGGSPTLVVFQNELWLVWHGVLSSQLWIAHSNDGLHWEGIQKIKGHEAWNTSITVFEDQLFMVYTHTLSSQLWMSQSPDGLNWTNTREIPGQRSSQTSIVTFKGRVVMVYSHPVFDSYTLYIAFFDHNGWTPAQVIPAQESAVPVLTTIGNWLFMSYSDPTLASRFWASRSLDGLTWQDTMELPGQHGDVPALAAYEDIVYMVYRIGRDLWSTSCEKGDLSIHEPIPNPTQATLAAYSGESYYVKINPSQYPGQPIPSAPMYYAVQEQGDQLTIHFPILYANQTGQTCRALRVGTEFYCALRTLGYHQGDLERVNITLQRTSSGYSIVQVGFEAHGNLLTYPPNQVKFEDDTHPIVHVFFLLMLLILGCIERTRIS